LLLLGSSAATRAADTYDIDPDHSMVLFKVEHLGVSNNWGRFNDISGKYTFDPADPGKVSFDVVIKADSVDTHSEKRDQHLRSPDFFNVKQFPVIELKSKSVKRADDGTYRVTADLTLHGVKKEVTLDVRYIGAGEDPWGGYRSGFESEFRVDRRSFGMNYMPGGLGDEVTVFVNIEGKRR